ncbi:unnamed protein product [Adineta steineri]|uniref:Uncharacterized protein n=1 Tax=Adineta steineri TaxID=433720 RepID=A0A814PIG3_9BILA|nr:unnamed protein product [Adineta steineri]CAF1100786.1 unnamed protein product [Adineta steineri]CAF1104697.1 unnamed protein product [Adineta steineri]
MIMFIVLLSASLAGCHAGITTGRANHEIYTSKITLVLSNSSAVSKLSINNTVNTTYQLMNMTQDNITEFSVLNFVSSKVSDAKHLSKSISAKHIVIIVVSILGFICLIGMCRCRSKKSKKKPVGYWKTPNIWVPHTHKI